MYGGMSKEKAECFGKPHINAWYTGPSVNLYDFDHDALCFVSRKPATNAHHVVPKGYARILNLNSEYGCFMLRTALFAVSGTGNSGVHGDFHLHKLNATWEWDDKKYEDEWWSGWTLSHVCRPHDDFLYSQGCWHITGDNVDFRYRGDYGQR